VPTLCPTSASKMPRVPSFPEFLGPLARLALQMLAAVQVSALSQADLY